MWAFPNNISPTRTLHCPTPAWSPYKYWNTSSQRCWVHFTSLTSSSEELAHLSLMLWSQVRVRFKRCVTTFVPFNNHWVRLLLGNLGFTGFSIEEDLDLRVIMFTLLPKTDVTICSFYLWIVFKNLISSLSEGNERGFGETNSTFYFKHRTEAHNLYPPCSFVQYSFLNKGLGSRSLILCWAAGWAEVICFKGTSVNVQHLLNVSSRGRGHKSHDCKTP